MLSTQARPTKNRLTRLRSRTRTRPELTCRLLDGITKMTTISQRWPVALTEFWMLHGFRPLETNRGNVSHDSRTARDHAGLSGKARDGPKKRFRPAGRCSRDLYRTVMTTPQDRIDLLLNTLITRLAGTNISDKNDPSHWAARASEIFCPVGGHCDRGIFSIYLLNLVHLRPGQGTFQPAGTLHAYLEGVTVELMANSDNVLRGGLTPKHVDVPGLMSILSFDSGLPVVMNGAPRRRLRIYLPDSL